MKYRFFVLIGLGLTCFLGLATFGFMQTEQQDSKLKLVVNSSKNTYLVGEVIPLSIALTNQSEEELFLENTIDPIYGSLKFYVSNDDGSIRYEYMNPKWGILEVNSFVRIEPDEKITNSKTLLAKINSDRSATYFFQKPGKYNLKVSYQIRYAKNPSNVLIESEPVQITIEEPVGEDLEVWNKIKDDGNFAYLIQEGDIRIPDYKPEERGKFLEKVEQIINQYPNSFYARSLTQSLDKFQAAEAKRQETMQKLKQKQPQ